MAGSADAAAAAAAADRPAVEVAHKRLLMAFVLLGLTMQVLDGTIANVALPNMQAALGANPESISWVLTRDIIAAAMVTPISGWLADRLGMRMLFLSSITLFVVSSVLCGIVTSMPQMVAFRVLQGIGGASLGPLGQSIIFNINRPSEHPRAMALFGASVMVGPIIGPILGGWLTENFNWRWVFLINLPLGVVCFGGLWWLMPRLEGTRRPFDLFGWALLATALASFQLLLDRGEHIDWYSSAECWIETGIAISSTWMFVVHSLTAKRPLFPIAVLKDTNLLFGFLVMFLLALIQLAGLALLPTLLQTLFGYPVLTTGFVVATRGVGVMVSMWLAGRLVKVFGPHLLMTIGFLMLSYSLWLMTGWTLDMGQEPILFNGIIQGLGLGLVFVPMSLVSFATLPARYRTDGAGITNLARNTGGSIGIAIASVFLARNLQISHADLAAHVTPYNLPLDPTLLTSYGEFGDAAMRLADSVVNRQASMIAFLDDFYLMFLATLFVAPLPLLLRRSRQRPERDESLHLMME